MEKLPNGLMVALAVVVVAASVYAYQVGGKTGNVGEQNAAAAVATVTQGQNPISGHLACLEPAEKDCQVGFVSSDGKKYSIDTAKAEFVDGKLTAGRNVWVLGSIGSGAYDGTIAVRAIVRNDR